MKLSKYDDLTIMPSEELQRKTLAAMQVKQAEKQTSAGTPKTRLKKVFVCAAAACAAVFLMGMGVRVFEYLTYVPGMGIVTAQQEEVYTLERVVPLENSGYFIEAMSMIPCTEGDHAGEWMVTVMTSEPHNGSSNPDDICAEALTLLSPDGSETVLAFDGGNRLGTSYKGYITSAEETDYILQKNGTDHTLTMSLLKNSDYAAYRYPVSNGLTVIAFPVAEGSDRLIFDIMIDMEDENWRYWGEQSDSITLEPYGITVTDTLGNIYTSDDVKYRYMKIPASEKDSGINPFISYKSETYLVLDRRMEAPAADIRIDGVSIFLENMQSERTYTVPVPAYGETVTAQNLPNGGIFLDEYGIKAVFESISGGYSESRRGYEILITAAPLYFDFVPDAKEAYMALSYMDAGHMLTTPQHDWQPGDSSLCPSDATKTTHHCLIKGPGDADPNIEPLDVDFGQEIAVRLEHLLLRIEGDWVIDFTTDKTE